MLSKVNPNTQQCRQGRRYAGKYQIQIGDKHAHPGLSLPEYPNHGQEDDSSDANQDINKINSLPGKGLLMFLLMPYGPEILPPQGVVVGVDN